MPGEPQDGTSDDPGEEAEPASGWTRPERSAVRYFHEFTAPWSPGATPPPDRTDPLPAQAAEGPDGDGSGGGEEWEGDESEQGGDRRAGEDHGDDTERGGGETGCGDDGILPEGLSFLPLPPQERPLALLGRGASTAVRLALAQSPVVVLVATVALVGYGAASPAVGGVGAFLPAVVADVVDLVVAEVVLWLLLAVLLGWLFASEVDAVGVEDDRGDLLKETAKLVWPLVVYGGLVVLAAGAALSVHLVLTRDPATLAPNVVFASGFLLLLYVGGPLVYDGMLRTEVLFERLHHTGVVDSDEETAYRHLRARLDATLSSNVGGVPTSMLIAGGFVAQFAGLWRWGAGPFNLDVLPTLLFVVVVDVVIVVVAVQFLVLVKFLNELLDDEKGAAVSLVYRPAHEDGAGGFRDLGQFATRVNTLLLLAGGYLVYRLHVQGLRDPLSPLTHSPGPEGALLWTLSYALPVAVYVAVIVVWMYFSFWQLHRKMVREKSEHIRERTESPERSEPADLERWESYENAPEWPIRYRLLVTIVSLDLISVVLSTASLL